MYKVIVALYGLIKTNYTYVTLLSWCGNLPLVGINRCGARWDSTSDIYLNYAA